MSDITRALGANQVNLPESNRIRSGVRMGYQAQQIGVDQNALNRTQQVVDTLSKFAQFGQAAYNKAQDDNRRKADERSNEIIRKLTPEQRREAIKNGTLLYQDDPYAMEALREKTGRNAAFLVDDDVSMKIREGVFASRTDMEKYRQEQLSKMSEEYANEFGINSGDEAYQRGFNSDITQRNISLYGAHDQFLSERAKQGNLTQSKVELDGLLSDPQVLRSPGAGAGFAAYINKGLKDNSIPSDAQAFTVIRSALGDAVNREGGRAFLNSVADQKVTLNGTTSTYRQLIGEEMWTNMEAKASQSEYQLNAKRGEKLQLGITNALNQEDANAGWEMLQKLKEENNLWQPGEENTTERQLLTQAQAQMIERVKRERDATLKATEKAKQADQKFLVMDAQFNKRLNGEYVATDYKNMPSNETTGDWSYSDAVNYANRKMRMIDAMDVPQEQKDAMKLKYLRADADNGPFRQAFATQVSDAQKEWSAAVINGELNENSPALNGLRRIMKADPSLVASLYPEQADLFNKLDLIDNLGVKPQIILDGERQARSQSQDMRKKADLDYADAKNDGKYPEMSRIPTQLDGAVRAIYDSTLYATGNRDMARQQASKWVKENTVQIKGEDVDGDIIGVIPRNSLTVNDDPASYKQGEDILVTAKDKILEANPWMTNKQLTIHQVGDTIVLQDTTGKRVTYTQKRLREEFARQQEEALKARQEEALKKATERAPISRVNEAKKLAAKRIDEKRKKVPLSIYGGKTIFDND